MATAGTETDMVFKSAAMLAALGWQVIPCHGIRQNGDCGCGRRNCASPGKHPKLDKWDLKACTTEDELANVIVDGVPTNIGIKWGPGSGVIDVEFDSDEGRETATRLGLDRIETPTYTSRRSVHRIFLYEPGIGRGLAVIKAGGLEIRVGDGDKAAQSIVPPSLHASGVRYEWKPGLSPDDVPVAPLPESVKQLLALPAGSPAGSAARVSPRGPRALDVMSAGAGEGERHAAMLKVATFKFGQLADLDSPAAAQSVLEDLRLWNQAKCRPPKPDDDVINCWQSAHAWVKRERIAEAGLLPGDTGPDPSDPVAREVTTRDKRVADSANTWGPRAAAARAAATAAAEEAAEAEQELAEERAVAAETGKDKAIARAERKVERTRREADKAELRAANLEAKAAKALANKAKMDAEAAEFEAAEARGHATLATAGFERVGPEWFPGRWRLEIIETHPVSYRVYFPWEGTEGSVTVCAADLKSAKAVALAVQSATGSFMLDSVPGVWEPAWRGKAPSRQRPAGVPGILEKLMATAVRVEPAGYEIDRVAVAAAAFLGCISGACGLDQPYPEDASEPDHHGAPRWVKGDGDDVQVWLGWAHVWQSAAMEGELTATERVGFGRTVEKRLGHPLPVALRQVGHGVARVRVRYTILSVEALAIIAELAGGGGG